jgi:hypothetical protein
VSCSAGCCQIHRKFASNCEVTLENPGVCVCGGK